MMGWKSAHCTIRQPAKDMLLSHLYQWVMDRMVRLIEAAEAKLLTQAHRRARELGLNWGQRRRLIPQRKRISAPELEATHG